MALRKKVLEVLSNENCVEGFHLREAWLAEKTSVSRSPVRAVLQELASEGLVEQRPNQGFFLSRAINQNDLQNTSNASDLVEKIYFRMAKERFAKVIKDQFTIAELVRRYDTSRATIQKVLARMQEDGLVEKTEGHSWVFRPALNDEKAYEDSYRYRLLVEPAAILEPGFHMSEAVLQSLIKQHEDLVAGAVYDLPMQDLFKVDAHFHETLAKSCGNQFIAQAMVQQTNLRRLSEYENYNDRDRLKESCKEHLDILRNIEKGRLEVAAALLRDHIQISQSIRPDFKKVKFLAHRKLTRR